MAQCRKCLTEISFLRLDNGKFRPVNPDGSDHFDLCRKLWWERVKREGKKFLDRKKGETAQGYKFNGKKVYEWIRYWPGLNDGHKGVKIEICEHDIPPWEDCELCAKQA